MNDNLPRQETLALLGREQLIKASGSGVRGKFLNQSWFSGLFKWFLDQIIKDALSNQVELRKITYRSQDASGQSAILSGLVIAPSAPPDPAGAMLLGFQHGTQLERRYAPSNFNPGQPLDFIDVLIAALFAMTGYTVAMADYPGLGVDPGDHPYINAKPLGVSVADLLAAVQSEQYRRTGIDNRRLGLVGYSEGGYTTMAAARELQLNPNYSRTFQIAAAAPLAGSYDLSGTMRRLMLSDQPYENGYYLPLTIRGYHAVYGDQYGNGIFTKERALKPKYRFVYDLVDGNHPAEEVKKYLPPVPREILSEAMINSLLDSESPVCRALQANDLYNWAPDMPMYLYHHPNDDQVPFANSVIASNHFVQKGRWVPVVPMFALPLTGSIHGNAAPACFLASLEWLKLYKSQAAFLPESH